jgi:hypothetical protein
MGSGVFNGKWTAAEKQNKKRNKNLVASGLGKVFAAAGESERESRREGQRKNEGFCG